MIKELIRTKSIIGALVGVYWKDSLYEQLDAKGKYENTLFAINDFFKANSLIKPIIIILEDLQWLDVDSKKIFEIISRNMNDSPITLICSSRYTDEGGKPALSIDKKILQNEIQLDHMTIDEIEELTTENLSGVADSRLLSYIALKSEGNPFYIEQFCKFLKENDVIDMREGKYRLLRTNIDIPKGISSVLIARIDRLSADLKEMVQLASVLGREFDVQVIEELMNVVRYSLEFETTALRNKDLNKMLIEGVHERIWNALSEIKYIFRHTMLQSAVYEMQLRSRLKKLHKIAGECIEKIYRNDKNYYSDIAFHYENAAVWDKATEYLEKAADYAKDSYQNEQALKVYDRLIGYLEDEEKEIVVQTKKAEVLQFIGEWVEAEKLYRHNINRALEIQNSELVAKNRKNLGSLLEKKGKNQEALTLLESVSNYYKEISDLKGLSSALGAIGVIYHKESDYDKAMEYYQRELNLAERMNDKKGIGSSVGNMGILFKDRNEYDKAMECYQKQLEISEQINDKIGKSRAYANMGVLHYYMQKFNKAIEYYQKQLYLASELGNKLYISNTSGNMGVMYYLQNNYDKAIQYYLIQQDMSEQLGNKMGSASASTNLGLIYMDKGEHEKSLKYFKTSYQLFKELNNKQGQLQILVNLIILNKMMNNFDKADEYCEEGIKLAEELNSDYDLSEIYYERAHMYLLKGKIEEAEKLNNKSMAVSIEIDEPKLITLTNILKSKIISKRGNNEEAKNILEKILGELDEDDIDNKAPLLFELFKLTGKDEYKEKSLEMFKEIYEEDNSAEIKSKIDELKDNISVENK
jgi:tetratricopeptide (TPR) repeat protein